MSAAQIFVIAVIAVSTVLIVALLTVAFRRDAERPAPKLDKRAVRRDQHRTEQRARMEETAAPAEAISEEAEEAAAEPEAVPVADPLDERPEVTEEEYGVSRRQFLNRSVLGVFGIFLFQFTLGFLAFFWPKLRAGGFGGKIEVGDINDIKEKLVLPDGSISPVFLPAAQAYVIPFDQDTTDTSFEKVPVPVIAAGVMALWQRCVHLGCRVPVCLPSQGFECPCHGSKYNFHGEYEAGPAPRNMDRFAIEIDDANRLIIDTGTVVQTARAKVKTIAYPQGPVC